MKHVQETLQLLSVMTKDHRFEDVCNDAEKGAFANMCEVLDRIEYRGRQAGVLEGRLVGRKEGRQEGRQEGENDIRCLMQRLFAASRYTDAERAANDREYCTQLLEEFGLTSKQ